MAVFDNIVKSTNQDLMTSVVEYHERSLLRNIMPALIHTRDMQMRNLPANNGRRVQFRRMVPFGALTRPLEEGVTPEGQTLKQTDLWATIKPYGGYVALTDEINWALIDNMQREANTLLSDQARLTIDTLARDALHSGLNVQYAGGRASRTALTTADKLSYAEIKKAVRTLEKANCRKFADGYYHAIIGPETKYDLTEDKMWVDVAVYQNKEKIETGELGKMAGVKFFETTESKKFEAEPYLFGTTASKNVVSWNATTRTLNIGALTDYECRQIVGKYVIVTGSDSVKTGVKIDTADMNGDLKLRWAPAATVTSKWTTSATVTPAGGGASGVEVHSTIIYGKDHAGGVSLNGSGHNISIIVKPAKSGGPEDPLEQRSSLAWKVKGLCYTILNDDFIVRIEHAVSA